MFWLGFGIGGDYPLLATIMSEYANKKTSGAFIAGVFAMQGFGILASGIVALIVSSAFDHAYKAPTYSVGPVASTVPQADYIWLIMPETVCYTALVAKNAKQAAQDTSKVLNVEIDPEEAKIQRLKQENVQSYGLFSKEFLNRHGVRLLGTTSWFLLDIAFYRQNLFQKDIFTAIGWIPSAAIALCSTVPGYWFTVAFINIMARFANCNSTYGFLLHDRVHVCNRYPIPSQDSEREKYWVSDIFLARLRGISAAIGKAGAIVGAFGFCMLLSPKTRKRLMLEPKGKSLEELSGENEDNSGVPSKQQADSSRTTTV
ncbi:unnamed protein product [Camellia sinensis]